MKIAVIDDYQGAFARTKAYPKLKGHEVVVYNDTEKDPEKLAARLKDAEVVVLTQQRSPFPRAVIERLPKLKMISQTGKNAYHIDLAAAAEKGIVVSAGGGSSPNPTAELTWAIILAGLRNVPEEVQRMKDGKWQGTVGVGLKDKTLGVYAFGRIGSIVAGVGRAFGMKVIVLGREASTAKAREAGYEVAASREAFFESADIVTLHLPLNKDTRGIVTAQDLARMKPTAMIVNTSRAPIIGEGALVEALKKGRPGFAAVDVYESEPVTDANYPLLKMKNVICTPHLGYVEERGYEGIYGVAVDQILAFAEGKPINVAKA
ncbi:MAG: 3-phosphoglycerate dehydrogenase [Betaproteobacteria bacterium]|nr:3-phosphoglycerate dehydrogenase [Betaproteobacteria bacterium]